MALKIASLISLIVLTGCSAFSGYERSGIYIENDDRIYEHRASFLGGERAGMAYSIAYWDVFQTEERGDSIPEVYYIWLRNNSDNNIMINPANLSLITEKGETIPLSPLTDSTQQPLKEQETGPHEVAGGYAVFEIPSAIIGTDKPGRLIYDDKSGIMAIRYLQVEDMKKYEGLNIDKPVYYYAPVYPRRYWYPYYYPYTYYPYDFHFYYFYPYSPRRHYYYVPAQPGNREFPAPPSEPARKPKVKKKREF